MSRNARIHFQRDKHKYKLNVSEFASLGRRRRLIWNKWADERLTGIEIDHEWMSRHTIEQQKLKTSKLQFSSSSSSTIN